MIMKVNESNRTNKYFQYTDNGVQIEVLFNKKLFFYLVSFVCFFKKKQLVIRRDLFKNSCYIYISWRGRFPKGHAEVKLTVLIWLIIEIRPQPPLSRPLSDDGLLPQIFHSNKTNIPLANLVSENQLKPQLAIDTLCLTIFVQWDTMWQHQSVTLQHLTPSDSHYIASNPRPPTRRFIHLTINQIQPPTYTSAHTQHMCTNRRIICAAWLYMPCAVLPK